MVMMVLDHVRDYFGVPGISPTNLEQTTPALFFTRWVTHFCAPVFFLLTGTGAYLRMSRRGRRDVSGFLLKRGIWLLLLELVLLRGLAWQFNFDYRLTMLMILWALGWAMITLSALVWLPPWAVTVVGVALMAGHNLLDGVRPEQFGKFAAIWTTLHVPGFVYAGPVHQVFVAYPLVPWVGVTAVGYGLGQVYLGEATRRRAFLLWGGLGLTAGFMALRLLNGYGDPSHWRRQGSAAMTLVSLLNVTKYPPSLLFCLMTLGPALLGLAVLDRRTPGWLRPMVVFGRVPLFFFATHATLAHGLAVAVCFARYGQVHWMFESPNVGAYPFTAPPGWGYGLGTTYLLWGLIVATLYPLCRWFAGVKRRGGEGWLSYV